MGKKTREQIVSEFISNYIKESRARFGIDLVEDEIEFIKLKVACLINKLKI